MATARVLGTWACSVLLSLGCNRVRPYDNFDRSGEPLKLLPAPGGLCAGDGAQKECSNPNGCAGSNAGGAAAPLGAQPASPGLASPMPVGYGQNTIDDGTANYPALSPDYAAEPSGPEPVLVPPAPAVSVIPTATPTVIPTATPVPQGLPDGGASGTVDAGPLAGPVDAGVPMTMLDAARASGADAGTAVDAGAPPMTDAALAFSQLKSPLESACGAIEREQTATLYLSADDSNSTASPVIARRLISLGQPVPPAIIRPYEFLNYYDFSFEPADSEEVRIVPQLSSCPVDGELNLQVALQSERRDIDDRRPLNVTFVLDTSGSMQGVPLSLQQAAVHAMAHNFRRGDVVSMVTWSVDQRISLSGHAVTGPDDATLLAAVDVLSADGGTDLSGGLNAGYALAEMHRASDRINRLVVISDGIANVGVTDEQLIGEYANDEEGEEGIYLAGIGVGDGVNDTLMNTVTDAGRGAYVYLDSVAEAEKMLGARFLEVIDVAARGVRLELTLPWYMQVAKFYGEEISTDRSKVRPQHLGPNSAMVFFQVLRACEASLIDGNDRLRIRATWSTPFERLSKSASIDATFNDLAGDDRDIEKAAVIAGYAEALQLAGDPLLSAAAARALLETALGHVLRAPGADVDPDLLEVQNLLTAYMNRFVVPL